MARENAPHASQCCLAGPEQPPTRLPSGQLSAGQAGAPGSPHAQTLVCWQCPRLCLQRTLRLTHAHTHKHICSHAHICSHMHKHAHICTHAHMLTHAHTPTCSHAHTCTHVHTPTRSHTCTHTHAQRTHSHMHTHAHTHTHMPCGLAISSFLGKGQPQVYRNTPEARTLGEPGGRADQRVTCGRLGGLQTDTFLYLEPPSEPRQARPRSAPTSASD